MTEVTPSYPTAGAFPPGAPPYAGPVEPPKKGMHGCLKGCLIAFGVVVVMTCVATGLVWYFWPRIEAALIEQGSEMVIQAVSQSAHLTPDEQNEMRALKDVVVKAIRENKFTDAHSMKIQASINRINQGGSRGNQQLTHHEVMRLMDDIEALCRDVGCDMTQVDNHRARRSKETETKGYDTGQQPPEPEAPPDEDGDSGEGEDK